MCGIAGIWELDGRTVGRPTIQRFTNALAHRGPDGEGLAIHDEGRLALGHRRLAILDLTESASQPMRSESGRYEIIYNGEVYNFLELKAELGHAGFRCRSTGDTAVVLAAFEQWGPDCQLRFNGMWSFAIWDHRDRALFLSRDRFGVKPLYVAATDHRLAFASELKAFLHLDGFDPVADIDAVKARLADNFADHVLLRGVRALPPGHCILATLDGVRCWRWWNTLDHLVSVTPDLETQAESFRALLFDSCRLRLRGDVPVATSLSGGLDSSSVLCSLAAATEQRRVDRQAPEWRRAFVAGFAGTAQDEAAHAALAAQRAGVAHVVHECSADAVRADIDAYLYQFEEIGGLFGAPAWLLYREMRRRGVVVSLDGHGADELLGGYEVHIIAAVLRSRGLLAMPRRTLDLIQSLRLMHPVVGAGLPPSRILMAALSIPHLRALAGRLPFVRARYASLDAMVRRHSVDTAPDAAGAEPMAVEALGPLGSVLYGSFHRRTLPRILRNFDVHSMGHGVEVRMPFLDWRLVCFAFSVPDESKVGRGYSKLLLREAMRGVLPDAVRLRHDKLGYNAPVAQWLNGPLREWLWSELNDPAFLDNHLWDGPAMLALAESKRRSRAPWTADEAHRVTLAVSAHWWLTRWARIRPAVGH
jgi:asparagine synthase (glutamine-hydrolysing)